MNTLSKDMSVYGYASMNTDGTVYVYRLRLCKNIVADTHMLLDLILSHLV